MLGHNAREVFLHLMSTECYAVACVFLTGILFCKCVLLAGARMPTSDPITKSIGTKCVVLRFLDRGRNWDHK